MRYQEVLPPPVLTQHIECFWELTLSPEAADRRYEVMAPDCTFDLILSAHPIQLAFTNRKGRVEVAAGGALVGQKTCSVRFSVKRPQRIIGIRFKPFALAGLAACPLDKMKDRTLPIGRFFDLRPESRKLIDRILSEKDLSHGVQLCEQLVLRLLGDQLQVDQLFRAQLNYIMDRKGQVEIRQLFSEFGVSKVTLHKHFNEKMGLSPKVVSRIWRLNHFLELERQCGDHKPTALALDSGYYDQAHFIREFKSFFPDSPRQFFKQNSHLLSISQDIIARRFSHRYDPVFVA